MKILTLSGNTTPKLIVIVTLSLVLIIITIIFFTELETRRIAEDIMNSKNNEVKTLADKLDLRLANAAQILEITSKDTAVRDVPYAHSVSNIYKGIPGNIDIEKRKVARDVVNEYKDFTNVAFFMPNGDIYILEPYSQQQKLKQLNFAFRDWYKGVTGTHHTYTSGALISAATHSPTVAIAVPILSDNSSSPSSLVGIWAGGLNLKVVSENLGKLELGHNARIVVIDHHGTEVADSSKPPSSLQGLPSALTQLESVKKALTGDNGSGIESVNATRMFIVYQPVRAGTHIWSVLSLQPYDDAFFAINTTWNQAYITILLITSIISTSGYILIRAFRSNAKLTKDLENAYEHLSATEKAKEEFISMISHELKTPLVPLKGYAQMLLRPKIMRAEVNDRQKSAIVAMSRNIEKLQALVDDVMDVYKLDIGKLRFSMTDTDITKLVNETISELKPLASNKKIDLKADMRVDGTVFCDPNRIDQVLSNLIKNSIDFVPDDGGGKVTVKVERDDGYRGSDMTLFSIEDNGIGIRPERADKLFQKFYQIDTGPARKHEGTGLGLAICRGIIDAHGGKIWLDTTYRNGAAIKFTLPQRGKQVQ